MTEKQNERVNGKRMDELHAILQSWYEEDDDNRAAIALIIEKRPEKDEDGNQCVACGDLVLGDGVIIREAICHTMTEKHPVGERINEAVEVLALEKFAGVLGKLAKKLSDGEETESKDENN